MTKALTMVVGLCTILALGTALMAATPDPYAIIDKAVAAMGGWDKLNAVHTSHSTGTLVIEGAGLSGTLEAWSQLPNKSRQAFDIKVMKQVSGDNGQIAWRVDSNGKLLISRDTATLKERQLGLLTATRDHLKRGSKVFTVTYDRVDTADGFTCHVLKTTNTINTFVFYDYYDTATYRSIKSTLVKPDGETQTVNRDFRMVDGVLTPFEMHQLELPTGQKVTIKLTSLEMNLPLDSMLFEPPAEHKRDFHFPTGKPVVEVPFKFLDLHIYLPLTINGKTKLWILDSGAESTVIEKAFAAELGIKAEGDLTGQGTTHTVGVSFATLPPFELNGLAFDSQRVVVIDMAELFHKTMGLDIGGILGFDFLSRLVTKVDYAHEMLTFYDPDSFMYKGDGVVLDAPLTRNNMFHLQITIDSQYSGTWDLDLGATGLDFLYPYAESHGLLNHPGVTRMSFGAGGGQATIMMRSKEVSFAGFTVPKLVVGIPTAKGKGAFSVAEMTGNAGNDLFRHFTMYLDYKQEKVIVEKGADFAKEFPADHCGMQVWFDDSGKVEVLTAAAGTPAEKAGILKGDKLVAIDGKTIDQIGGILAVRELLKGPVGTRLTLDVIRDGKARKVALLLKDLYE